MAIFTYHINLDERGDFSADVRRGGCNGPTVFEIHGTDIFEDGFMKHKNDMDGLTSHLRSFFIMTEDDRIGTEAEAEAEASSNVLRADSRGNLCLPNGDEILHRYPQGDYDSIAAADPNLQHLHAALYDARECGEVPNVSEFILPNGEKFNIDTFKEQQ